MAAEVVLVTGGALRLGAAMCAEFARRGCTVLCHYGRSADAAERLVKTLGEARAVQGDLSRLDSCDAMFERALALFGRIDVLINCAAMFEADTGIEPSAELLDLHWQVNTRAPAWLASRLARHCREREVRGSIVHILDQKVHNLNPDYFSYTMSKLALAGAVPLQAQALAPHVRVNGIAPGLLAISGPQSHENFEWASTQNLLRRPVSFDDVARTTADIAFNPALSGSIVEVDCGQHLVPMTRDVMYLGPQGAAS